MTRPGSDAGVRRVDGWAVGESGGKPFGYGRWLRLRGGRAVRRSGRIDVE